MGYYLQAFIGKTENIEILKQKYDTAVIRKLDQGISIIELTKELFLQINQSVKSEAIKSFEYLTWNIENQILKTIGSRPIGYIEAFYWGGEGSQSAIIWKDNSRKIEYFKSQTAINEVLSHFGVKRIKGQDEFATLDLGILESDRSWDIPT